VSTRKEEIDDEEDGMRGMVKRAVRAIIRTIKDFANIVDVSVVTHPAYPQTSVDARNLIGAEVRSRVALFKKPFMTPDQIRQRINEPSFEDRIEEIAHQSVRNRRLSILDL
jgi:hypothetical protein